MLGSDDEPEDFNQTSKANTFRDYSYYYDPNYYGYYREVQGTSVTHTKAAPWRTGIQLICNYTDVLAAGLVIDLKARHTTKDIHQEQASQISYRNFSESEDIHQTLDDYAYGLSPTLRFTIPVADTMHLIAGFQYTNWGSQKSSVEQTLQYSIHDEQDNPWFGHYVNDYTSPVYQSQDTSSSVSHITKFGLGFDSRKVRTGFQLSDSNSGYGELIEAATGLEVMPVDRVALRWGVKYDQSQDWLLAHGITCSTGVGFTILTPANPEFKNSPNPLIVDLMVQASASESRVFDSAAYLALKIGL
jgi:hypothetical protein